MGYFCSECGAPLNEPLDYCPECGAPLKADSQNTFPAGYLSQSAIMNGNEHQSDVIAVCAMLFSILLPPIGLIFSVIGLIIYRSGTNKKLSIVSLVISIILGIVYGIILAVVLPDVLNMMQAGNDMTRFYNEFSSVFS